MISIGPCVFSDDKTSPRLAFASDDEIVRTECCICTSQSTWPTIVFVVQVVYIGLGCHEAGHLAEGGAKEGEIRQLMAVELKGYPMYLSSIFAINKEGKPLSGRFNVKNI